MSSTLKQLVDNFTLAFTSCLCKISESARRESLDPSQVFSEHVHSPGHEYSTIRHLAIEVPRNMSELFKSLYIFPPAFLLSFLVSLLFAPSVVCCLWQPWCKTIATDCFQQMPLWERLFALGEFPVRSNKGKACNWYIPGNHQTNQIMTVLWNWGFKEAPTPFCCH